MVELDIRRCEARHLPRVLELLRQLGEASQAPVELRLEDLERLLAGMEQVPATYLNLVATLQGQVVGFLSVVFYQTLFHRGGTALINELVVDRERRGAGLGRALVERAREEAVARGMDELEVSTERANHAAQGFYRKCGFGEEYVLLGMEF